MSFCEAERWSQSAPVTFKILNRIATSSASRAEVEPEPEPDAKADMPARHRRKKVGRLEPEGEEPPSHHYYYSHVDRGLEGDRGAVG